MYSELLPAFGRLRPLKCELRTTGRFFLFIFFLQKMKLLCKCDPEWNWLAGWLPRNVITVRASKCSGSLARWISLRYEYCELIDQFRSALPSRQFIARRILLRRLFFESTRGVPLTRGFFFILPDIAARSNEICTAQGNRAECSCHSSSNVRWGANLPRSAPGPVTFSLSPVYTRHPTNETGY